MPSRANDAHHSRGPTAERRDAPSHRDEPKQAEQAKKISGWAAIIFAPSLIAGIYGMNFTVMPWLSAPWGRAIAILIMVAFGGGLFVLFRTRHCSDTAAAYSSAVSRLPRMTSSGSILTTTLSSRPS